MKQTATRYKQKTEIFLLNDRTKSRVNDKRSFIDNPYFFLATKIGNALSIKLTDSYIKTFLNKRLTEKPVTLTAEKKDLVIVLPFLRK